MNADPVYIVNLLLSIAVLALGVLAYHKQRLTCFLYIGIGFGLFGISHAMFILGLESSFVEPLVFIRIMGYALVAYALYTHVR